MGYTWKQFNDEVRIQLPLHKDRDNAQDLIDRQIRFAVLDLQQFIKRYRAGHELIYCPTDFVLNNKASLGRLPQGAVFKEGYVLRSKVGDEVETLGGNIAANRTYAVSTKIVAVTQGFTYRYTPGTKEFSLTNGVQVLTAAGDFIATQGTIVLTSIFNTSQPVTATLQRVTTSSDCLCGTHPVLEFAWDRRLELVDGQAQLLDNNGLIAIDDEGSGAFYLYPAIVAQETIDVNVYSYKFRLVWDGVRLDFGDEDPVPFDEPMVNVVAMWVNAELARVIDKDLLLKESYDRDYHRERLNLYLKGRL